jgi:hypothetical protein
MNSTFSILALILSALAYPFYIRSVLKSGRPPNQVTWLVFLMVDGIILLAQIAEHKVAVPIVVYCIGMTSILGIALVKGNREWTTIDKVVLGLSLVTMILWYLATSAMPAILLSLIAMYIGSIPLFQALIKNPDSEPRFAWFLFWLGSVCEFIANGPVHTWQLTTIVPIIGFFVQQSLVLLLGFRPKRVTA